jgi:zinc/manganese transport system permease protein
MNGSLDFSIVAPALAAGVLVTATHVPLGMQVLRRGIVFIDLAVAQIAGLGVIAADRFGLEAHGAGAQLAALAAALGGALLLTWTDRRWPRVQEAIIGVTFIVAANAAILLLASSARGAEHLKDLLAGQILWVDAAQLWLALVVYAAVLGVWFTWGERIGRLGFYALFAITVTISVQLVGLYLVFATLIVPALATGAFARWRLPAAYSLGAAGYALGLGLSLASDLPAGPLVVCTTAALGAIVFGLTQQTPR